MENKATQLILGPPGTGKTTELLNIVDKYFAAGGVPEKVGFISFTKKAVDEARARAIIRFGFTRDSFLYFRTIHSLAFYKLNMSKTEVMQRSHYRELGNILGIPITGIHRQDQMAYEMSKGDQLCFIEALSRLACKTLDQTWIDLNNDIALVDLDIYQRALVKYKKAKLLYDFTDMLVRFKTEGQAPKLDLLVVDEAQDLCKLQWEIVNKLMTNSDKTFIAGDDDQAIFRWSGADVDYFLGLAKVYETRVLKQSYRLPKTVFTLALDVVKRIEKRNEKVFRPTTKEGVVEFIHDLEDINMDTGDWLLLVRNSYLMQTTIKWLRAMGYPYQTPFYSTHTDDGVHAAFVWEKLRAGQECKPEDIELALSFLPGKRKKVNVNTLTMDALVSENIVKEKEKTLIWHSAFTDMDAEDRNYFIAVRRRTEALNRPPRIKVSTIHGAKGGECDNVVLFQDISQKTYRGMKDSLDDESRVFYVGITRAKQKLYIMQPKAIYYYQI